MYSVNRSNVVYLPTSTKTKSCSQQVPITEHVANCKVPGIYDPKVYLAEWIKENLLIFCLSTSALPLRTVGIRQWWRGNMGRGKSENPYSNNLHAFQLFPSQSSVEYSIRAINNVPMNVVYELWPDGYVSEYSLGR